MGIITDKIQEGFVIPSKFESADLRFDILTTASPPKNIIHKDFNPVIDQGQTSTCVAQTLVAIKFWQENREFGKKPINKEFSPAFIYNQRSNAPQDGMMIKDALDILLVSGVCFKSTFNKLNQSIPKKAYEEAMNNRIRGYARITELSALKKALFCYGPILGVLPVFSNDNTFWVNNGQTSTNHAITVIGYDDEKNILRVRNSWGIGWGDKGYTDFPYTSFDQFIELWVLLDKGKSR